MRTGLFGAGMRTGLIVGTTFVALAPAVRALAPRVRALVPAGRRIVRSWPRRVAVEGDSMRPALRPGDWLLVDPDAFEQREPEPGEIVVVPDPRKPDRWLVKRVAALEADGLLRLSGDAPDRSTDSRAFGPVGRASLVGLAWARYWPPRRVGRVR